MCSTHRSVEVVLANCLIKKFRWKIFLKKKEVWSNSTKIWPKNYCERCKSILSSKAKPLETSENWFLSSPSWHCYWWSVLVCHSESFLKFKLAFLNCWTSSGQLKRIILLQHLKIKSFNVVIKMLTLSSLTSGHSIYTIDFYTHYQLILP